MSKEYEKLTEEQKALNGLANFIIMHGNNDDYDASAIEWHSILKQALTKLERLKKFKETFDNCELVKKQGFIAYENWIECEKELEELKQEVIARQETENSLTQWVADLTTELTELKSWRDELSGTIQDLISKAKHWEEKENKTDFEKGIARGYKTMLHQLLVGIDFDKEIENDK